MNEWINKSRTGGSAGEKEAGVQQRPKEKKKAGSLWKTTGTEMRDEADDYLSGEYS